MKKIFISLLSVAILFTSCNQAKRDSETTLSIDSIKTIAKEAYIYAYPMIDAYRIEHAYFVDSNNPEFKAPWNQIRNIPKVYTPADKAVQTPNSDTPYSMAGLDLRAEPMILQVPKIEKNRYFSIQLIDSYTANFDYIGTRTTGNDGGTFMIAGPNWKGETPEGVTKVFYSETELIMAIGRTQLYNEADLVNIKKIQSGYILEPLSSYLNASAPSGVPAISFMKPLNPETQKTSIEVFNVLNFLLQLCPTHPSEKELMARFAKIGIGAGNTIDSSQLSAEVLKAMEAGIQEAWTNDFAELKQQVDAGEVTSKQVFGTRAFMKNNYLYRMAGAVLGIFGNSAHEAMYPIYTVDDESKKLDASENKYTLHFTADQLPPVHAFWSLTMYELPSSLLVENPINRYLLNSPMLDSFKRDGHGGITFYVQNTSPGKDKESNWLPAPKGPFMTVLRLYWPEESALDGSWKNPPMQLVK